MWYSAKLLFESSVADDRAIAPLCEESIIIIEAEDEESARKQAVGFGRLAEHSYKNPEQKDVAWKFVEVLEVQDLCEDRLSSGSEVYSRLYRKKPAEQ